MAWTIDRKHDHVAVVTMNTNKVNAQNAAFFGGRAQALALSLSMDLTDAAAKGRASQIRIWVAKSTLSWGCKGGCGPAWYEGHRPETEGGTFPVFQAGPTLIDRIFSSL
jgi:hypothetical protein